MMYRRYCVLSSVFNSLSTRYRLKITTNRTCFTAPNNNGLMRAIQPDGFGSVSIVDVPIPEVSANEYLMKVSTVGLNRADLLQIAGKYPPPKGGSDILGLEASGYLDDGRRATALLTHGAFGEYCAVPKTSVLNLPVSVTDDYSMAQLAAIPEAFIAAYHIMFDTYNLQPGQTILLNAAASGVGVAAIQLAVTLNNVTIIGSAGSNSKLDLLHRRLQDGNIDVSNLYLVNYKTQSISDVVADVTSGRGVQLAMDCVGPAQFKHIERSLAREGTWVIYGLLSGAKGDRIGLAGIVSKHLNVRGTTLRSRSTEDRARIITEFVDRFGSSFATGSDAKGQSLCPIIHAEFSGLDSVKAAFQMLENNENVGKIVVTL